LIRSLRAGLRSGRVVVRQPGWPDAATFPEETVMPKLLAIVLVLLALLCPVDPAVAQQDTTGRACPGIMLSLFEQRFPDQVQRYAFDHAMLEPFVQLWRSARRPDLPLSPERVTVYALPGLPYLIGYQHGDCVIAFLAIERQRLLQLLRPQIGWPV
jgi:hypothetical protein